MTEDAVSRYTGRTWGKMGTLHASYLVQMTCGIIRPGAACGLPSHSGRLLWSWERRRGPGSMPSHPPDP
jgi:hypothetical protein